MPELDEAANTIKEEVGDDANIIFGSSFDDSLSGKIRVSIVVTGINDNQLMPESKPDRAAEPSLIDQSYDDETFVPTVTPKMEIETLKPVEMHQSPVSDEPQEAKIDALFADDDLREEAKNEEDDNVIDLNMSAEDDELMNDFSGLDKSDEFPEVPQASALFSALMKNNKEPEEDSEINFEFDNAKAGEDDFFASSTAIEDVPSVEEPELFKDNDISIFKDVNQEEPEDEMKVETTESPANRSSSFIDRFMGISLARKKNHEQEAQARQDVKFGDDTEMMKTGTDDVDFASDDLDIPAFLRRK